MMNIGRKEKGRERVCYESYKTQKLSLAYIPVCIFFLITVTWLKLL
jgi:hypothetical protein